MIEASYYNPKLETVGEPSISFTLAYDKPNEAMREIGQQQV